MSRKWVEALFERLIAYHGTQFLNQFVGDMDRVKLAWEAELGQFDLDTIKEALDLVKIGEEPPNLQRMISLCRQRQQARPKPAPALPPPPPESVRRDRVQQIQGLRFMAPSSDWAIKVLEEIAAGVVLPRASEQFAVEALINCGRVDDIPGSYASQGRAVFRNIMEARHGKG